MSKPEDASGSALIVSRDVGNQLGNFAQRCVLYGLAMVLLFAGASKALFWSEWSGAVHFLPIWMFPPVLVFLIPSLEMGMALAAFWRGPVRWVVYLLRALGFCFWTASFAFWYFAPEAACPCFYFGDYTKVVAPTGIAALLKAGLFLAGAVYLNVSPPAAAINFSENNK